LRAGFCCRYINKRVVLSGCPSGVNKASDPDGPALLPAAFRLAGARTVVAPIWNVPDRQTTTLMISFYQNLANGMTKTEALRQAQLSAIKNREQRYGAAHPFFWASFRAYGVE
jgi:CHAT domain-containing protein